MLAAGMGIKMGFFEQEPGAEVYSIATTRDQAKLSWIDARSMVKANPLLSKRVQVRDGVSTLSSDSIASFFRPLGRDKDSADGVNPYCAIADELHRHKDDELLNVMSHSMLARDDPLMLEITTAGIRNETSIGWKHHLYGQEILDGIQENDRRFVFIAGADEEDREKWNDPKVWKKANPAWNITVFPRRLKALANEAEGIVTKRNDFLRYHLNFWVEQESVWIPVEKWAACRKRRTLEELKGKRCYGGLDLAQTEDINALVLMFRDEGATEEVYDVLPFFWLPEPTIKKRKDKVPSYPVWARQKLIRTTPREVTDYSFIERDIMELFGLYQIEQIWYDPNNATQIAMMLADATGNPDFMVKSYQQARHMHEPCSKVEALVNARNLRHGDNPVLRWMNNNVWIRSDSDGNIKIDKEKSQEKVDGMVAMAMAMRGWIHDRRKVVETSIYADDEARPDGFLTLEVGNVD